MNRNHQPSEANPPKSFETGARPRTLRSSYGTAILAVVGAGLIVALSVRAYRERISLNQLRVASTNGETSESSLGAKASIPLAVMYSVVWEGQDIRSSNIDVIQSIRAKYPQVQIYHFVSPGYFSRPGADTPAILREMRKVIRSDDLVGIYFNGWRSLVERSGVDFRFREDFWGNTATDEQCRKDCGNDISLRHYSAAETNRIFKEGLSILADAGFSDINAMMVGGWLASESVLAAAANNGVRFSFTQIWPSLLESSLRNYPLLGEIQEVWRNVKEDNFALSSTYRTRFGEIAELGNSAAAVDFIDVDHVMALFNRLVESKRNSPNAPLLFHVSLHQETAAKFGSRFEQTISKISDEVQRSNLLVDLSPRTSVYGLKKFSQLSH